MTVPSPSTDSRAALARRLRDLRLNSWPGRTITQRMLAEALGREDKPLSLSLISAWENESNPTAPPPARLHDYATFFATKRSVAGGGRLIPDAELTADEIATRDELYHSLVSLRTGPASLQVATAERPIRFDWQFPGGGNIRIVCGKLDYLDDPEQPSHPYTDPSNPNYTDLHTFADADSLIELFGHLRKVNPSNDIRFFRSDRLEAAADSADELASDLILLGGIGLNTLTGEVLSKTGIPIRQKPIEDSEWGEGFEITAGDNKGTQFLPVRLNDVLTEDVGLLARMPNPFNSTTTLTICDGVFATGVLGAARTLTDDKLRRQNESCLASRFNGADRFAILMRVPVLLGTTMTPDLRNASTRLFEWSDDAVQGDSHGLERAGQLLVR